MLWQNPFFLRCSKRWIIPQARISPTRWEHGFAVFLLALFLSANLTGSVWTFLLVGMETARNKKVNPHLVLGPYRVPTWALLLCVIICTEALIPSTSLTGHMCGAAVGYVCMWCSSSSFSWVSDMSLTVRNRWPRASEVDIPSGKGAHVDRVQAEPSEKATALCQR